MPFLLVVAVEKVQMKIEVAMVQIAPLLIQLEL
jgi:hypothetical protein